MTMTSSLGAVADAATAGAAGVEDSTRERFGRREPSTTWISSSSSEPVKLMGVDEPPSTAPFARRRLPANGGGGAGEPFVSRCTGRGRATLGGGGGFSLTVSCGVAYLVSVETFDLATHCLTHCLAVASCFFRFVLYSCAIEGTSGSLGFGSVRREDSERMTL